MIINKAKNKHTRELCDESLNHRSNRENIQQGTKGATLMATLLRGELENEKNEDSELNSFASIAIARGNPGHFDRVQCHALQRCSSSTGPGPALCPQKTAPTARVCPAGVCAFRSKITVRPRPRRGGTSGSRVAGRREAAVRRRSWLGHRGHRASSPRASASTCTSGCCIGACWSWLL
jgi:hypothetical protein